MQQVIPTKAFSDQKPGTSGLRKKTTVFQQPHYLQNFVQSLFNTVTELKNGILVLGGDGRFYNHQALQIILKMACANGVAKVIIGQNGLLSTPAVSHIIRKYQATGGIVLSASHNPGGSDGDFGIKYNIKNGGPAPEKITSAIYQETQKIAQYLIEDFDDVKLSEITNFYMGNMEISVIDSVKDYTEMMQSLFNFEKIKKYLDTGFDIRFDALHAITGPYAKAIFCDVLKVSQDKMLHINPLEDFGGLHPDPNPQEAPHLVEMAFSENGPDFIAASDGDGDRNMILGKNIFVNPSDSIAIMTANAHLIPAYKKGLKGVARSMPTSTALDKVAQELKIDCYETPTGWKFFGNLLDADKIQLCGEESFGNSSNHVREKDGLWAVLFWLNVLAEKQMSVKDLVLQHWHTFGRHFYSRHDYVLEQEPAQKIIEHLRNQIAKPLSFQSYTITNSDEFSYTDPIDGSVSQKQGLRFIFNNGGARIVFRLSGTGTQGATLRVYLEKYEQNNIEIDTQEALKDLIVIYKQLTQMENFAKKEQPDVIV